MASVNRKSETSLLKINMSHHSDKFAAGSQELVITKKANFVFGKNGTGKTTISDEILAQLSTDYDVYVFKDFDGVVENNRLNAVALGTKNAKIQKEIDIVDAEIADMTKQVELPEDADTENFFSKAAKSKAAYDKQEKTIDAFYTSSAQKIKNQSSPQIAKTSYNKAYFQSDIPKANLLSKDSIAEYKNIIKADKKPDAKDILFPKIDLSFYLESVNEILQSSVAQTQDIPELTSKADWQAFARQGMRIHEHKAGEICAFCGNEISEDRWQRLGSYFNDEVKKLENRIAAGIEKIDSVLDSAIEISDLKKDGFYDQFSRDIKSLNLQIAAKRSEYKEFFENLKTALEGKKSNLFIKSMPLKTVAPAGFDVIEKECKDLVEKNNALSLNLETDQNNARDALRYHEVKIILDDFKYGDENIVLATLKSANDKAQEALSNKKKELQKKQEERKALILQTKDEEKIAEKISKLLSTMGVVSFSLKLVEDDVEDQKGQYQIKSHDGNIRPITHLSKGEKNIIAFLYFIFSLESVDSKNNPKIIVLDDPMTSNDDTMQYLMIGEIQKLYKNLRSSDYFILLTHNCHFYLNVRPDTRTTYKENGEEISFYKKYGVHHLFSDGKHTTIKCVDKGKQDFATSYETLWKELAFLYAADAPSELMLSPCRKICETYMKFTKKSNDTFYADNTYAKKLFDVNQHSIDDFEAEANGKTKSEIITILYNLFKGNSAEEHFSSYWKGAKL